MRSVDRAEFEKDERHFLYREYLKILADHQPPVFIMENVKGLLSSTVGDRLIFNQILSDLSKPNGAGPGYRLVALGQAENPFGTKPEDFVVRSESIESLNRVIV